ncbi:MAG: GH3 auxin-responsive promoter family protein [Phycisphaerae bacterium]|nr:GH3 auxin-responsive promoter family protein [Phycisphaerae bacterium]
MSALAAALNVWSKVVQRRIRRARRDPVGMQRRVFERLLRKGRRTAFGRQHGFDRIRTPDDFARAVPVADYVGRLEMFERIVAGERDVAWPGRVRVFAQTSGTTAGDKRIPLTREMMRANRRAAMRIFAYYDRRQGVRAGDLFRGKLLFLGGSTDLTRTESGALIGDLSGIATRSIVWPISRCYEPGKDLALIDDWEQKVRRVAERTVRRDVRFVTGMPSWVKVLFDRLCELRGVAPEGGISRIWPNLRLFVHGGVNFAPYRRSFERYFAAGAAPEFLEVYPASEGFIGIQAERDRPDLDLLTDNGLFYEFVPLSEWGRDDAPRLTVGRVEPDVPYCVVLSTCAGLWAYDLGDVVRFTSVRPPRLVFAGRNKHFINAFGENIIGEQVSAAVAEAAAHTGAEVAEFTAGPIYAGAGRPVGAHEYVVEFSQPPGEGVEAFAAAIDDALKRLNHDYAVKRGGDVGMTGVEVTQVPRGTFYAWMKQRGKLGGQHKVPVCANDRTAIDALRAAGGLA